MKSKNPIRPQHRERLLDLSSSSRAARPGRLDLFTDADHPRPARRRMMQEAFRHMSDEPESWVNRHLRHRVERMREQGEDAPDLLLPVAHN